MLPAGSEVQARPSARTPRTGFGAIGGGRPTAALARCLLDTLGLLLCAGLCACGAEPSPATAPARDRQPRHLVLVVIDTLRADHVGPGGYARETTPHLDALAERGTSFANAFTHSPRTRTAMGALMSGLLPSTSGLIRQEMSGAGSVLAPGITTLAERFAGANFETRGVVSNVNVSPTFGFAQGFDHYIALAPENSGANTSWLRQTTEQVTQNALEQLDAFAAADRERSLFLYVHYLDPHSPYDPPAEHQSAFRPESYLTGRKAQLSLSRYDGEIRHVDDGLGRILARLNALGMEADTVVAVTSDHGEEFNDHGGWNHGETHYDEVLRVPLVLALPGEGSIPNRPALEPQVRLIDLVPTFIELFGMPADPLLAGRSLLPVIQGIDDGARPALAEAGNTPLATYRQPPWKLIVNLEQDTAALFDIARDPLERHDIARHHPDVVTQMRSELESALERANQAGASIERSSSAELTTTEEQLELMKALGYVEDEP